MHYAARAYQKSNTAANTVPRTIDPRPWTQGLGPRPWLRRFVVEVVAGFDKRWLTRRVQSLGSKALGLLAVGLLAVVTDVGSRGSKALDPLAVATAILAVLERWLPRFSQFSSGDNRLHIDRFVCGRRR